MESSISYSCQTNEQKREYKLNDKPFCMEHQLTSFLNFVRTHGRYKQRANRKGEYDDSLALQLIS